ncbi:MAG: glycosyltransferase [Bacteroidia bacterium]|nr:glycosyltransferase [Bacteroidia bacterium]
MSSLVFWQNIPSIHQAPLIREVAKLWDGDVWVVAESDVSSGRLRQGWVRPVFSPAKLIVAPSRNERLCLLEQTQNKSDVHVFSGFNAYPETYWTMKQARKTAVLLGVFAEPGRHNDGLRSWLRRLHYILLAAQWRRRLNFLLATGDLGVRWYSMSLFPKNKIFSFGYFVDVQSVVESYSAINNAFTILFVGQLIFRKGVDLLMRALGGLREFTWNLRIVGDGPLRHELGKLACELGINERIVWEGGLANDAVKQVMAASDLLVLPSRYDGWGAVVNEALMAGTPVVVSDACGASELIQNPRLGGVFQAQSVTSLQEALRTQMVKGGIDGLDREYIQTWSKGIHPQTAAQYLHEIILKTETKNIRILAPWRKMY